MGGTTTLREPGDVGVGITIFQVVPALGNNVVPVVRDFEQAWKATEGSAEPSHLAMEGYINARVFCEGLRRAKSPTRAAFVDAIWQMVAHD